MDDDLKDVSDLLAELYGRMTVVSIKDARNKVPWEQVMTNSVDHLLLVVAERFVTWSQYNVGRTSRSERVFTGFRNTHVLSANLRIGVNAFLAPLACFAGLAPPLG